MAPRIPEETLKFMEQHGVRQDEVWAVSGGRAYAVKHSALERIAAENKIEFGLPDIIEKDSANRIAVMCVTAVMPLGDSVIKTWSIGEASPHNYLVSGKQAAYPWAMAEKRAKDRCILKLLGAHGALYSDAESDDFKEGGGAQTVETPRPEHPINNTPITDAQLLQLRGLLHESGANVEVFCQYFEVADVAVMPQGRFEEAKKMLHAKIEKARAQA